MAAIELLIGLVVVVIVVSSVIIGSKTGWFEGSDNAREDKERLSARDRRDQYTIPLRRRVHAWPMPLRIAGVFAVLLALTFTFMAYQLTRSGSSPTDYLTLETYIVLAASAGVVGGVLLKQWSDGQVSWLTVMFEDTGGGGTVRRIPFMTAATSISDGSRIIQTCRQNRILGLFWRFEQVGDRRELRGAGKLPGDRLEIQLPDHAIKHDDGVLVETSPDGDTVIEGPSNPDKTFGSPNRLSTERAHQMRRENKQHRIRKEAVEAVNAEMNREMDRLYEKIESREHMEREDFKQDVLDIMGPIMGMSPGGPGAMQPGVEAGQDPGDAGGQAGDGAATDGGQRR